MTNSKSMACLAVALIGIAARSSAYAQDGGAPAPPSPTAEHKILAEEAGTWDASVKAFMAGPDAPPMVSKGVEVNEVLPGGLWVISRFKGEFGGMPFEGHGQLGYDPIKKKFVGTWIDSMSPTIMSMEGTYDAKTKTLTYKGENIDPASKAKYTQTMVTTTKADGTRVFTLSMSTPGGEAKEAKMMEITYTKRK